MNFISLNQHNQLLFQNDSNTCIFFPFQARREEMETRKQMAANQEMLEVLQQQKAALAEKKKEEERLLAEEAKLMVGNQFTNFT